MKPFTLRTRRVEGVPVAAVRIWLLGGSRVETLPGQAAVTGRMLAEGTRLRDWKRIAEQAEDRGMALWSFGGLEAIGVAVDALAGDWRQAVEWAAEMALEPAFPEDRCAWIGRQAAAELESLTDQPEVKTARVFMDSLYRPHPKGRPVLGSTKSLLELTTEHCWKQYRQAISGGILMTVTGEIDEEEVRLEAERLFGSREYAASDAVEPPRPIGSAEVWKEVHLGAGGSAHLYIGHRTVPADHPQLPALELAAVILGAGPGLHGRLPMDLRESRGLAYAISVDTVAEAGRDPGYLSVYLGTAPETLALAERVVREQLERFVAKGPTESEVREARSYLLGRQPFRRETARQWADLLALAELYGVPVDRPEWVEERILGLDRRQVHEAVRDLVRPEDLRVVAGIPGEPG